jgi:leucyl aminopeptidase (aminopeptidase T)
MRKIELTGGNGKDPDPETCSMMKDFSVIIAPTKYSLTHCAAVTEARKSNVRVATLPGITNGIFERGMKTDPLELKTTGDKLLKKLEGIHSVKVQSPGGTDIEFKIGKYKIVNDDGCIWKDSMCGNLPAGEIFVAPDPESANGTLVIDGSIGSFDWKPDDKPAIIKLENGKAVSFEGERGKELEKTLGKHGNKGFVLAEFGIGSNPYVKMGGNLLEDEKIKGTVHFAFGDNCGFGGSNSVPVHIDGLVLSPSIVIDEKTELMKNGEWLV